MANRPRNTNRNTRQFRNKINRNRQRPPQRLSGGIKRRTGIPKSPNKAKVMDARQKILSKKRQTVRDARDILTNMAKTQDAREKLLKMRQSRKTSSNANGSIRPIGTSILKKTDRNGKISLITSKNKQNDINLTIQEQLGLIQKKKVLKPVHGTSRKPISRSIPPSLISKTILNDLDYQPPPLQPSFDPYAHSYLPPDHRLKSSHLTPLHSRRIANRSEYVDSGREWFPSHFARTRPILSGYIDLDAPEDEEMPLVSPVRQTISMHGIARESNVHSRLDTAPLQNQSHGIFASAPIKTKVVVPAGHRIVVSNLQPTVTQDDIRELFEDIGQLLVARLVRPGTAEVIYKNLKDAQKAVDTYHNRQLDGQPMKCLLVNKRPLNNPTGPALTSSKQDPTGVITSASKKPASSKTSEKLVPDLQTIHKVLFQRT